MMLNRLCNSDSRQGLLRWLESAFLPGDVVESIEYPHLLRSMAVIVEHKDAVE